ncbi:MAG: hypothetical protein EBY66_05235 [Candidatus Fonsibacter lacus]|nr:hypothetical protein [Candidatus Fonsibacter lacus]
MVKVISFGSVKTYRITDIVTDGAYGWHVERGAPMKPVGGRILTIEYASLKGENTYSAIRNIDSMKFPL